MYSGIPSASRSRLTMLRSSTRSTRLSPNCVGNVETRRSILRPAICFWMRPSCGSRLGDIHAGHHFHPRNHRECQMPWRWRHLVKRTIDAIADFEFVFERLEVNVARAVLDRLVKNEIHKTDDRRRIRLRFNRSFAVGLAQLQRFTDFAELLEHFLHARRIGAVILLDQLLDLL